MKRFLLILIPLFLLNACSSFYQVKPEEYKDRVKRLGVVPLIVDAESTILHPQRDVILSALRQSSEGRHRDLAAIIAEDAGYAAVIPIETDPTAAKLLQEGVLLSDQGKDAARHYRINPAVAAEISRGAGVDALLVVVLNGVDNRGKRWERKGTHYLEENFNEIQATALVVAPDGTILWERPGTIGGPFIDLQYVDFDGAYYNRTDIVEKRFITVDGLKRRLSQQDKNVFGKDLGPSLYRQLFHALGDALTVSGNWRIKWPASQGEKNDSH